MDIDVDRVIHYLLSNFGYKGGRYLLLDHQIDELAQVVNVPTPSKEFYSVLRERWKLITLSR